MSQLGSWLTVEQKEKECFYLGVSQLGSGLMVNWFAKPQNSNYEQNEDFYSGVSIN